ncbi:MAG: crossover junction endodeoxyribonuclease RuvC [Neisseriaceae bacterium]|nr:MAG: crossover junction endodeoxyribonuclease RuvC [Neisseriaceae bacterium]
MRILGIDPGSRYTGFGIIDISRYNDYSYIVSGVIKTNPKNSLPLKINTLATSIQEIIDTYHPDEVAIEQIFININSATSLILGQARGGILAAVSLKKIPIYEYTALQVKKAVVGNGKASKKQVQHMLVNMLKLSATPTPDAADAIAVAFTHSLNRVSSTRKFFYLNKKEVL